VGATKKKNEIEYTAKGSALPAAANEIQETIAEAPAIVLINGLWVTPDGCRFNTRLKADKHINKEL
jgi:hypothetical protein